MKKLLFGAAAAVALAGTALLGTAGADGETNLRATLHDASGAEIGTAKISFELGDAEVKVEVQMAPSHAGFHGFHIHSVGQCTAAAGAPAFGSAGGHLGEDAADPTHRHRNHAGDLPVLLVNADGHASARVETDRLDPAQLQDANGSAFIVHAAPDNYANIPATDAAGVARYSNANAVAVYPNLTTDAATLTTGDAGGRIACGVIR